MRYATPHTLGRSPCTDTNQIRSFVKPSPACFPRTSSETAVLLVYTYSPMRRTHSRLMFSEGGKMGRHQGRKYHLRSWASTSTCKPGRGSSMILLGHMVIYYIAIVLRVCRVIERVCRTVSVFCSLGPAPPSASCSTPSSSSSPSRGYASSSTISISSQPSGSSVGLSW